jgi:hypothetical protein
VTAPLPSNFAGDCQWLVQAVDPHARLSRLIRMDDADYRKESFLDDRMLAGRRDSLLCNLDELIAAADMVDTPPAAWIFHIGHVGSTLVSRLLGEMDGVLAIREPRSLRDLAHASKEERPLLARAVGRLMARRGTSRKVIVKATSFVSEFAPLLVEPEASVLFLHASPANYVASILAGENSLMELDALHEDRIRRLGSRDIVAAGFGRNHASKAALAWACEMTSLEAASEAMSDRILWADFDIMLRDMPGWIERCARHFGLDIAQPFAEELAKGPLMRRYSKAPEYDYSPELRAELLADATYRHRADIEAALDSLSNAAKSAPLLERALKRSGQEF